MQLTCLPAYLLHATFASLVESCQDEVERFKKRDEGGRQYHRLPMAYRVIGREATETSYWQPVRYAGINSCRNLKVVLTVYLTEAVLSNG